MAWIPLIAKDRCSKITTVSNSPSIAEMLRQCLARSWCIAATAFVIYLSAFPGLALQAAPLETAGAYLFSWGVGFIAIFAPQGIGVFEVVAADLMRGAGTFMSVAALLGGFRIIVLAADATVWVALHALSGNNR